MSDHLDFIRIRGLEDSELEVFQGIGATGSGGSSDGGTTPATEWSAFPIDAIEMMETYTDGMIAWQKEAEAYTPDDPTRGMLATIPSVPAILGSLALAGTGAVSLPVLATGLITQSLLLMLKTAVENYAKSIDANSLEMLFKKAFLFKEGETIDPAKFQSIVKRCLEDLRYNDEELDFGAFRAWLHGKIIEY